MPTTPVYAAISILDDPMNWFAIFSTSSYLYFYFRFRWWRCQSGYLCNQCFVCFSYGLSILYFLLLHFNVSIWFLDRSWVSVYLFNPSPNFLFRSILANQTSVPLEFDKEKWINSKFRFFLQFFFSFTSKLCTESKVLTSSTHSLPFIFHSERITQLWKKKKKKYCKHFTTNAARSWKCRWKIGWYYHIQMGRHTNNAGMVSDESKVKRGLCIISFAINFCFCLSWN